MSDVVFAPSLVPDTQVNAPFSQFSVVPTASQLQLPAQPTFAQFPAPATVAPSSSGAVAENRFLAPQPSLADMGMMGAGVGAITASTILFATANPLFALTGGAFAGAVAQTWWNNIGVSPTDNGGSFAGSQ